ncbi:glycosyltransferase, partial [Alcanivorax sp.]|uniref:glycosyltransferase n=1 Tax=Alcanivorax sp. TaxID=1872427 RepID=UPI002586AA2A
WQEEGVIEWWGHRKEMADVLAGAHLVCLPSYREGLPKVLIEAAASGRAIVTCDVPGCREVVAHDENGLLVPARDAAALADAIRTLLEDPARRRRLGEAGRMRAERLFGQQRVNEETLALYRELLNYVP